MSPKRKNRIPPVADTIPSQGAASSHVKRLTNYEGNCTFSFKYLQSTDKTFTVEHSDADYYHKLIERLQALSNTPVSALMADRSSSLRCHPIDWTADNVSRASFGIPKEDELCDKPYQIVVSANKYGRLHGFFTGDIFNIVWFDREHKLYPGT